MRRAILIVMAFALVACEKNDPLSGPLCGAKPLFSTWTSQYFGTLDLSDMSWTRAGSVRTATIDGATCWYRVSVSGNECSGLYVQSGAMWLGDGSGDPGCSDLNVTTLFMKSDVGLYLCEYYVDTDYCSLYE